MIVKRIGIVLLLTLALVPALAQNDELRQWASDASATSAYSETGWNAQQATGEPNTRGCGDIPTAWASRSPEGVDELTVFFETPVIPSEINIHQTFGRGSIAGVELIPSDGGDNIVLRRTADEDDECPGVFTIEINQIGEAVIGVVIKVDQRRLRQWNQIDAVELVGEPTGEDSSQPNTTSDEPTDDDSSANSDLPFGRSVDCDGAVFDNGVEFTVIQMRVGSTYTVTAIGLNGFDPILAVLDDTGDGLCNDNEFNARELLAELPTTDDVPPADTTAQVVFTNTDNGESFRDVTFVVGGRDNMAGQFVLIVEGMTLSSADGQGDPMSVYISPSLVAGGVPLTAYMISITAVFDPWIGLMDSEGNFLRDDDNNFYACDNAGTNSCWGESGRLSGYSVSRSDGRELPGGQLDAMLMIPLERSFEGQNINYLMSTIQGTYGDYVVAFHAGVGEP